MENMVLDVVSNITGYPPEDLHKDMYLEADLGLDSIKIVELMNGVMQRLNSDDLERLGHEISPENILQSQTLEQLLALFTEKKSDTSAATKNLPIDDNEELRIQVIDLVANITGFSTTELDGDIYLEADLGLDSIKMVELMNGLIQILTPMQQEKLSAKVTPEKILNVQTLNELLSLFTVVETSKPTGGETQTSISIEKSVQIAEPDELHILNAQYSFLVSHWTVCIPSLVSHVRIKGKFNAKAARQAWGDLIARHPMLRIKYIFPEKTTRFSQYLQLLLKDIETPELEAVDLSLMDADEQVVRIEEIVEQKLNESWNLQQWPLHQFTIVYLNEQEHEIFLSNHHLVSDGLHNHKLLHEFLELYAAAQEGRDAQLSTALSAAEYNRVVDVINQWQDDEEDVALACHVKQLGKENFIWNPNKTKLSRGDVNNKTRRWKLPEALTCRLISRTEQWRLPMNTLIIAAYLRTLKYVDGNYSCFYLNMPTSGVAYPNADAKDIVGCFAQNISISFDVAGQEQTWETLLQHVDGNIKTAIASGIDRSQTRQTGEIIRSKMALENGKVPESMAPIIRAGIKSNLYLPYIGQVLVKKNYSAFETENYWACTSTNPMTIDLLVEIYDEQLQFTANHDGNFFDAEFIDSVLHGLERELKNLATHDLVVQKVLSQQCDISPILEDRLRQIIGMIIGKNISEQDCDKDFEAVLGIDSLDRIRVASKLYQEFGLVDRSRILSARTIAEVALAVQPHSDDVVEKVEDSTQIAIPLQKIIAQCYKTPQQSAVVSVQGTLSYGQLHQLSNQLANYLKIQGVNKASEPVGVMLKQGPMMLVGILAVLKTGAAYVPMDHGYPSDRLRYIIKDAKIQMLLSESGLAEELSKMANTSKALAQLVLLDNWNKDEVSMADGHVYTMANQLVDKRTWSKTITEDLTYDALPSDLMTILYTSGSTGKPKGVMLAHEGYYNRLMWMQKTFPLAKGDRVANKTSPGFDISIWEMIWPLMFGATVCPISKSVVQDPWQLADWIEQTDINVMHFVPSLFGEFIQAIATDKYLFPQLKLIVFSGEALPVSYVRKWMEHYGNRIVLANLYGPTEASIDVTAYLIDEIPPPKQVRIPIGKAISNVELFILNDQMQAVVPGELGHLWLGGIQLSRGYLNKPEATSRAFKLNPFSSDTENEIIYDTGDLVVELMDGNLEFHGRVDSQVKIRGFRVELGEIEAVLDTLPGIRESVVLLYEDNDEKRKRLVAFCISDRESVDVIACDLRARLPDYMIPHHIELLTTVPKSHNGKLDRNALKDKCKDLIHRQKPDQQITGELRLPLGPAQRWVIAHYKPPYLWAGYTRFCYKHPLDLVIFNQALQFATEKHDALRSYFSENGSEWLQFILPPQDSRVMVDYFDGSELTIEQRNEKIHILIEQRCDKLRIDSWPLWKVMVIKESSNSYQFVVVGHHMICDMLSNNVLFKNVWSAYTDIIGGKIPGLLAKGNTSYAEYVSALMVEMHSENIEKYIHYWREKFSNIKPFIVPKDNPNGGNLEKHYEVCQFTLPKSELNKLLKIAKTKFNTSLYRVLLPPLYRLLANWAERNEVIVSHRMHGRDLGKGRSYFDAVGNFAVNYPAAVKLSLSADWAALLMAINREMDNIPLNGVSYDWIGTMLPGNCYPDSRLTEIRANYLGNLDSPVSSIFEFVIGERDVRRAARNCERTTGLEFFFSVASGELSVDIGFSSDQYHKETIQRLGNNYIEFLKQFITVCTEQSSALLLPQESFNFSTVTGQFGKKPDSNRYVTASSCKSTNVSGALSGKVVIVTGGSRGIGRGIALNLARQGATVVILARSAKQITATVDDISAKGYSALGYSIDVTQLSQVEEVFASINESYGRIDVLVNSAGITGMATIDESDPDKWRNIVEVNLFGTYNCCRTAVPYITQNGGGKIVNISSVAGFIGLPLFSAYAASKHAVLGLTKSLSEELKQKNVQVNAICPALVATDMAPKAYRETAISIEQVADVVAFLSSSQSDSITGESMKIYGKQDVYMFGSQQLNMTKAVVGRALASMAD